MINPFATNSWDVGDISMSPNGFNLPKLPGGGEWSPEDTFGAWLKAWNGNQNGNFSNWMGKRFNTMQNKYRGELSLLPELSWQSFLGSYNPKDDWDYTNPYERGEQQSAFAGRNRYIM